jgi:hypothetical protein
MAIVLRQTHHVEPKGTWRTAEANRPGQADCFIR